MDRTVATGTGFIGQYRSEVAKAYENLATCPDDLLLFLHHVPYTYKLHDGKSVIQYIYDSHYEGAAAVAGYAREWKALEGRVDERRYHEVLAQLEYQSGQAVVWRDAVDTWFQTASGIPDAKGRVGHEPGRIEAEAMSLDGYTVREVTPAPAEDASGGKLIACPVAKCTATHKYDGPGGWFDINVEYFDQTSGTSTYQIFVGSQLVDEWKADLNVAPRMPAMRIDSTSSTRRVIHSVALRSGDEIRIVGAPNGREPAAVDYIEIKPQ
jgi:alpha-glucuronidase